MSGLLLAALTGVALWSCCGLPTPSPRRRGRDATAPTLNDGREFTFKGLVRLIVIFFREIHKRQRINFGPAVFMTKPYANAYGCPSGRATHERVRA
jgi:hypothetical protein